MYRTHLVRAETKVIDADEGLVSAIVSTETPDRSGDIIRVTGWDLKPFRKHPILLSSHSYDKTLLNQIGKWDEMKVDRSAKTLNGVAKYHIGKGNPEADWGFFLASENMAAFSVGFIPDMNKAERIVTEDDDSWWPAYEFKGQELLEVSHVTVPANPEALQNAKTAGLHPVLDEIADEVLGRSGVPFTTVPTIKHKSPFWFMSVSDWAQQRETTPKNTIQEAISQW